MKFLLLGIISTLCLGACMVPVSMQSGRTLGKGKMQVGASLSVGEYYSTIEREYSGNNPVPECSGAWGVTEDLDLMVKFNMSGYTTGIVKYQILGSKSSFAALSVGLEAGVSPLTAILGRIPAHASVPLYFSLHPYQSFTLYCTPRYLYALEYRGLFRIENPGFHRLIEISGLSYGAMFGQDRKFIVELSQYSYLPGQFVVSLGFSALLPVP